MPPNTVPPSNKPPKISQITYFILPPVFWLISLYRLKIIKTKAPKNKEPKNSQAKSLSPVLIPSIPIIPWNWVGF